MKMTELTEKELVEINGGAGTTSALGISLTIGGNSLLRLALSTRNGDDVNRSTLVLLNGLNLLGLGQLK
ncbi:class IIb bacteriocin, lactobin A/cerein 7B family [Mucilaginibacter conchicola]|uniref:Class IIb bacteriocin, lactobin A/cerein 7B family n=1 Tax=Mucilaginibacter conchicola TaxID=2303333 RepID=A0A372NZX3_9SPHI|nr:class IIb bacteriocin, lactobin A/cerein 7B family [Mucilaginibacter conchicola]RFZ95414.1 class IIb bacteriocin, lactobin A/cerein 7B family [Mucilaginibacter conchicola]